METTLHIHITGLDGLASAIMALAAHRSPVPEVPANAQTAPTASAEPLPAASPVSHVVPAVVPAIPGAISGAPVPFPVAVPLAAPAAYDLAQLSQAGAVLRDAGKLQQLQQLLTQTFGVQSMQQLPPERYGEFAAALRGMGAQI